VFQKQIKISISFKKVYLHRQLLLKYRYVNILPNFCFFLVGWVRIVLH